jgi:hypothetical protein
VREKVTETAEPEKVSTVIVVPTRNRPEMAAAAVRSVLGQGAPEVGVLVSDNSTWEDARREVSAFCAGYPDAEVRLVRPEEPLPMAAHWDFAIHRALETEGATHFAILTDRMMFKQGGLRHVIELARRYTDRVVSYHEDMIDDFGRPVQLLMLEATGRAFEISAEGLLEAVSKGTLHHATPRMLNSITPREVIEAVDERFGNVFASISPDLQFGYRCLALVDSVIYWDEPPLVHYELSRSNGLSYGRGVDSADSADFKRQLGGVPMNFAAPVPELITIRNACFHEYCVVRALTGSERFPAIDLDRYLYVLSEEVPSVEDPLVRERMRQILAQSGWRGLKRAIGDVKRMLALLDEALQPLRFGRRVLFRYRKRRAVQLLARLAGMTGSPALGWLRLDSVESAMRYAGEHPRGHERKLRHLKPLTDAPGTVRELTPSGT